LEDSELDSLESDPELESPELDLLNYFRVKNIFKNLFTNID